MAEFGHVHAPHWRHHPAVGTAVLTAAGIVYGWLAFFWYQADGLTWAGLCAGLALAVAIAAYHYWDTSRDLPLHVNWMIGKRGVFSFALRWHHLVAVVVALAAWGAVVLSLPPGGADAFMAGLMMMCPMIYPRSTLVWREAWRVYREKTGAGAE